MTQIVIVLLVGWIIYGISKRGGKFWDAMAETNKSKRFTYWNAVVFAFGLIALMGIIWSLFD